MALMPAGLLPQPVVTLAGVRQGLPADLLKDEAIMSKPFATHAPESHPSRTCCGADGRVLSVLACC